MKQKTFYFKSLLLLALMVLGVSSAWADESNLTFKTACGGSGTADDGAVWTITSDGAESTFASDGIHYGTKSASVQYLQLSTSDITGTISKVEVKTRDTQAKASVTVNVGETSFTCDGETSVTATNETTAYAFTGSGTGEIVVRIDRGSSMTKAIYVLSVIVTYSNGGDPTPTVTAPILSKATGSVEANTVVTITNKNDNYLYFYTTGDDTPVVEGLEAGANTHEFPADGYTVTESVKLNVVAVDEDDNMSDVTSAEYTVQQKVHGLTVDFENALDAYADWTFTNVGIHTDISGVSAHGGSYWGANINENNNAVASCSIQTNGKVEKPGVLTFYISKESNNTTSSTWYVEVSSDGSSWTEMSSESATSMSKGVWTEVTSDLSEKENVYVRIRYNGSNAIRAIDDISIAESVAKNVETPTFSVASGEYESAQSVEITCATDGATVYYTIDGTDPDNNSTEYTGAIAIGTTTTLKAIAYKGEDASNIATATYTINLPLTTIAKVKELTNNSTCRVNLTDAQVVFVDGDHIYVRDASGALEFYKSDLTLVTGDIFDATIAATYTLYNGQPELTKFTKKDIMIKGNSVVVAKEISTIEEANNNVCDLVKFAGVQLSESGGKYYIGETGIQLYDKFNVSYTTETDADVDVTGVVILYQRNNTGDITTEVCPRFAEDIVYLGNSVAVGISSATGYATFCSDKALDFTAVDAIYAYIATVKGSAITFTRVTKIPANTGVLLRSTEGGAVDPVNVPVLTAAADDVDANKFVPATTEIPSLASTDGDNVNYILNNGTKGIGFYKANGQKVAAGKAYLQVSASQAKDMTFIGFDETTGVELMGATESTAQMFNLAGQRVCNDYKGIVIVNGKKVIR